MKDILPGVYYNNLMLLHWAMYVYSYPKYHKVYFTKAQACLKRFAKECPQIYYHLSIESFDFHAALHFPGFVKLYGTLDNSFPFENYLCLIKKDK
jgi:hypothetical protein